MKKLVTPIPQNTTELATPAPVSWIILTFVLSYLLNLSLSRYAWTPDFLALSMVFWVVHQPRRVGQRRRAHLDDDSHWFLTPAILFPPEPLKID